MKVMMLYKSKNQALHDEIKQIMWTRARSRLPEDFMKCNTSNKVSKNSIKRQSTDLDAFDEERGKKRSKIEVQEAVASSSSSSVDNNVECLDTSKKADIISTQDYDFILDDIFKDDVAAFTAPQNPPQCNDWCLATQWIKPTTTKREEMINFLFSLPKEVNFRVNTLEHGSIALCASPKCENKKIKKDIPRITLPCDHVYHIDCNFKIFCHICRAVKKSCWSQASGATCMSCKDIIIAEEGQKFSSRLCECQHGVHGSCVFIIYCKLCKSMVNYYFPPNNTM
jgi:hypothetical protein